MIKFNRELLTFDYLTGNLWYPLTFSTLNYSAQYSPDSNRTLIIGSETLTFSMSGAGVLALASVLTLVRLKYSGHFVGSGYFNVDTYQRDYSTDPDAQKRGKPFRTEASCTAVSAYAAALDLKVTYNKTRPTGETAKQFIEQWVTISNWPTEHI